MPCLDRYNCKIYTILDSYNLQLLRGKTCFLFSPETSVPLSIVPPPLKFHLHSALISPLISKPCCAWLWFQNCANVPNDYNVPGLRSWYISASYSCWILQVLGLERRHLCKQLDHNTNMLAHIAILLHCFSFRHCLREMAKDSMHKEQNFAALPAWKLPFLTLRAEDHTQTTPLVQSLPSFSYLEKQRW